MRTNPAERSLIRANVTNISHPDNAVVALLDDFEDLYAFAVNLLVVHEDRDWQLARQMVESIHFARHGEMTASPFQDGPQEQSSGALVVHVLHGGFPACMFSVDVPRDWPPGNKWVELPEREKATCPACRRAVGVSASFTAS